MVLVERLDLAVLGIEPDHGTRVETVTGVESARPRRGVADTPLTGYSVLVVGTGHPGRSAARLPVVALPCVMAGLAFARDGEGAPQFLAIVGVERDDIAANAKFATRAADHYFSVHDQRHQGHVLTLLVVLDLLVPNHLAGFGVKRDDMIVGRGQVQLVLP